MRLLSALFPPNGPAVAQVWGVQASQTCQEFVDASALACRA